MPASPPYKTCLFDIDGTLVQTGGAGQVAFAEVFADQFGIPTLSANVSFAGRSDRAIALDLMQTHGIDPSEHNWQTFRQAYAQRLPAALSSCVGRVLPGVESLIDRLVQQGDILIGLLTGNLEQTAELKLAYYQLWQHFDFGGFGDTHTSRNDIAATAVAAAGARHGIPAASDNHLVVVIGDTQHDVTCGQSVGARTVAVPTGNTSPDVLAQANPDLLVETLEDTDTLLGWFAG